MHNQTIKLNKVETVGNTIPFEVADEKWIIIHKVIAVKVWLKSIRVYIYIWMNEVVQRSFTQSNLSLPKHISHT